MSNKEPCIALDAYAAVIAGLGAGLDLPRSLAHADVLPSIWESASAEWQAEIDASAASDLAVLVAFDAALIAGRRRFAPIHEPIESDLRAWAHFRRHFLMAADPPAFLAEHGLTLSTYARVELGWSARLLAEEALSRELQSHMAAPLEACPTIVVTPSPLLRPEGEPRIAKAPSIAAPPPLTASIEPPMPMAPPLQEAAVPPPPPVAMPKRVDLGETTFGMVSPIGRALPFSAAAPAPAFARAAAPPRAPQPPSDQGATEGPITAELPASFAARVREALPFGSTAPAVPRARPETMSSRPSAPPELTLERYASLCAELVVYPQSADAIFVRYGLVRLEERQGVDQAWKERLRLNAAEYKAWKHHYTRYYAYLIDQAKRDAGK